MGETGLPGPAILPAPEARLLLEHIFHVLDLVSDGSLRLVCFAFGDELVIVGRFTDGLLHLTGDLVGRGLDLASSARCVTSLHSLERSPVL